ncbi:hypothetical protein M5D10_17510 [Leptospira santarosai]|uniref:hypothetical protein n=2 Tax=Leptospira santarosai TaxID=28183 RepID=UPI000519CBD7|nr:hypothetical protein [Leptospira santarosai]MBW9233255.1 hypothetical protein [Leptospira santarosai]MDI7227902.1 hypothetical protein [Leptospira santarosai]UZN09420.1 hypothetical protein M5D10_17510 [Leptospira santarosai]
MKVTIPIEFDFIMPEIPDDIIDNTSLTISFILQARSAFIRSLIDWNIKYHPNFDEDTKQEYMEGILNILKNPSFYEKEITSATLLFKAEEQRERFK